jgi:hypothetical protein
MTRPSCCLADLPTSSLSFTPPALAAARHQGPLRWHGCPFRHDRFHHRRSVRSLRRYQVGPRRHRRCRDRQGLKTGSCNSRLPSPFLLLALGRTRRVARCARAGRRRRCGPPPDRLVWGRCRGHFHFSPLDIDRCFPIFTETLPARRELSTSQAGEWKVGRARPAAVSQPTLNFCGSVVSVLIRAQRC